SAFFAFVVNEAVAGRGERVKAYSIAVEALGRGADFDPSSDTSVRTTANRLRRALRAYYANAQDARVVICLPTGRYTPSFEFRDETVPPRPPVPALQPEPPVPGLEPEPARLPEPEPPGKAARLPLGPGICALVAIVLVIAVLFWPKTGMSGSVLIDVRPVRTGEATRVVAES